MHFHTQGQSYQFKAIPFGLSTVPMEFMVVAKEVKLLALQRGIRIQHYLTTGWSEPDPIKPVSSMHMHL